MTIEQAIKIFNRNYPDIELEQDFRTGKIKLIFESLNNEVLTEKELIQFIHLNSKLKELI